VLVQSGVARGSVRVKHVVVRVLIDGFGKFRSRFVKLLLRERGVPVRLVFEREFALLRGDLRFVMIKKE
jgi:hypothetical protein